MTEQTHDQLRDLTGLYVLGALEPADRAALQAHLATCPECEAEVRSLLPIVDGLLQSAPLVEPPAGLRARVMSVAGTPDRAEVVPFQPAAQRPAKMWLPWLAAAAALLLCGVVGWYAVDLRSRVIALEARLDDANARAESAERRVRSAQDAATEARFTVAVLAAPDLARVELAGQQQAPRAHARAFWSRSRGLVFTASDLPPLPAGKVYQLWVVTAQRPISAGLLQPDQSGAASVVVQTPRDIGTPLAMAVTIEPEGGVPAPTGDKYLIGVPSAGV